ncbi:hypothetical protein [Actinomadura flavalba]|uniref:hypothetical protein n=1 Tax=Actinomadura flavalba TaxID=1120938 RepID=UPI000380B1F2|nr:hypothetical protein [Actinomadura flavalba]
MPVPRPVRDRCREFLGIDDEFHYVFPARARGGGTSFLFVVTADQVLVLTTGSLGRSRPRSVWGTYPRTTRLGPLRGGGGFEFGGSHFEIDGEYVPLVNAADTEVFDRGSLPRDPLPDL